MDKSKEGYNAVLSWLSLYYGPRIRDRAEITLKACTFHVAFKPVCMHGGNVLLQHVVCLV